MAIRPAQQRKQIKAAEAEATSTAAATAAAAAATSRGGWRRTKVCIAKPFTSMAALTRSRKRRRRRIGEALRVTRSLPPP
jgi:hypothetical protein